MYSSASVLEKAYCYRYIRIDKLDDKTEKHAKDIFDMYSQAGTICDCNMYDLKWRVTDEVRNYYIDFSIDELKYRKTAYTWALCSSECYISCMKAYFLLRMGELSFSYLKLLVNDIKALAGMDMKEAECGFKDRRERISEFLSLIPSESSDVDALMETFEDGWYGKSKSKSRELSGFTYYLRFDRMVNGFWGSPECDRVRYFPIYMWWKLTNILPLRVTEFLLTRRDCLSERDGKYYLKVRRTKMKKGCRKHTYMVRSDYTEFEYKIPEWLYRSIDDYRNQTQHMRMAELDTLFVLDTLNDGNYFTYSKMKLRLKNFCESACGNRDYPVHLGDTRHLAMINLILSGGSPEICRQLADHEDVNVSAGYYSNLSTVVESVIYEKYHGWEGESAINGFMRFTDISEYDEKVRIGDGYCTYEGITRNDISECIKVYDRKGRLGDCINCLHYIPDDPGLRLKLHDYRKKAVDEDAGYILKMIELVRQGKGYQEDIMSAMLRLQASAYRYGRTLTDEYERKKYGKTKEK